jgi:hypothetical protein
LLPHLNVLVSSIPHLKKTLAICQLLLNLADMEYNRNDAAQGQKDYAANRPYLMMWRIPSNAGLSTNGLYAEIEKNYSVAEAVQNKAIPLHRR